MTLAECCEPVFQSVCRLNRSARKGVSPEMDQARTELQSALAESRSRAEGAGHAAAFVRVEIILLYFVDFMVRQSKLSFASQWSDLARERGRLGGDEDFFDQLDETLKDKSDEARECLGVYYSCIGLGFTGWYTGQGDFLRKKMQEVSSRLRGMMDADRSARICPESYEHVNTADLVQPPSRSLAGVVIVAVGLAITLLAANIALYLDKRAGMSRAFRDLDARQARIVEAAKGGTR